MIDKIGGRKMALAIGSMVCGVVALFFGKLGGTEFVTLALGIVGAFTIGNGVEHVAGAMETKAEAAPLVDLTPVVEKLEAINSQNEQVKEAVVTSQQGIGAILQIAMGGGRQQT